MLSQLGKTILVVENEPASLDVNVGGLDARGQESR
jgi:hypothetical protein